MPLEGAGGGMAALAMPATLVVTTATPATVRPPPLAFLLVTVVIYLLGLGIVVPVRLLREDDESNFEEG
jgi:hypothetical protein